MSKVSTSKSERIKLLELQVEIHLLRARIAVAKIESILLEPLEGKELHSALEQVIESARHTINPAEMPPTHP